MAVLQYRVKLSGQRSGILAFFANSETSRQCSYGDLLRQLAQRSERRHWL